MSTHKVAYNTCYGGFSLSEKAKMLYRELTGMKEDAYLDEDDLPRHDPVLISVIEKLGTEANGSFADIAIRTINSSAYRISDYDGIERVLTPYDEKYIYIEEEE